MELSKPATTAASDHSPAASPISIGKGMQIGISSFGSWMIGVGSIIGSMAWLIHGPMIARSGPAAAMTAWLIAGLLAIPLALILMELSSMFPTAGGPYVYKYYALKQLLPKTGELFGFLTGWLYWITIVIGLACMSCGLVSLVDAAVWGSSENSPVWFGPAVILVLFGSTTILNFLPIKKASKINMAFTIMKFAMAIGFAILVISSKHCALTTVWQLSSPSGNANFMENVASVLMLALAGFAFLEAAACTSSETVDARKTVPKTVLLTLISVMSIYLLMCFCICVAAPLALSTDKSTLMVLGTNLEANCPSLARFMGGPTLGNIFMFCVIASIFGCGLTALMGTARVCYSMAETKLFPKQFTQLNKSTGSPTYALAFQFCCLCLISISANLLARSGIFTNAYTFLGEVFGFMYALVAMLYGVCVVSLRYTDPHLARSFRIGNRNNILAWIMALITIIVWGFAAFACVHWTRQLTGILVLFSGVPVYWYYRQRNQPKQERLQFNIQTPTVFLE